MRICGYPTSQRKRDVVIPHLNGRKGDDGVRENVERLVPPQTLTQKLQRKPRHVSTPETTVDAVRTQIGALVTEASNPNYPDLAALSTQELVTAMNGEDALVPAAIAGAQHTIAAVIDEIAARMSRGGRLIYVGAGTPGRMGILDASECPPTFGTDPSLVVGVIAGGQAAVDQA